MNKIEKYSFDNDDLFNRKDLARNLSKIVEESNNSVVLAVDSYWGSGKTTFIKKWKNSLDEEGKMTIYLDAWENDYFKDPIIPLIGKLESILELDEVTSGDVKVALKNIAYEIIKSISVVVDLEKIEGDFSNTERNHLEYFKNLDNEKELIKTKLEEISKNRKIYFFIDELDRCKPLFSINLLERIKHFFNLENFIFVLAVDLSQLGQSVKSIYGEINTKSYFRKFFDLNFHLPPPEKSKYFEYLFIQAGIKHFMSESYVKYTSKIIKNCNDIGLRECNKIFDIMRVCHHNIINVNASEYIFPYLIVFKVLEPENYKVVLAKEKIINESLFTNQKLDLVYHDYEHIQNMIKVLSPITAMDRMKAGNEAFNTNIKRSDVIDGFCDYMSKILEFANFF